MEVDKIRSWFEVLVEDCGVGGWLLGTIVDLMSDDSRRRRCLGVVFIDLAVILLSTRASWSSSASEA